MNARLFLSVAALMIAVLHESAKSAVLLDTSPGTSAPPATLGPYSMTPFGLNNVDPPPGSSALTTVASPLAGNLTFSFGLQHERAGLGGPYTVWNPSVGWGQGYAGDVYLAPGPGVFSVRLTLPANTPAFYLYLQPNPDFPNSVLSNLVTLQVHDGSAGFSGSISVDKARGAEYVGFYESTPGNSINDILLGSAVPLAIGEFGITTVPEPSTVAFGAIALTLLVARRVFRKT